MNACRHSLHALLDSMLERIQTSQNEVWLLPGDDSIAEMENFVGRAECHIAIVAGECYQRFFANFAFLLSCQEFLGNKGVLELAFFTNVGIHGADLEAHLEQCVPSLLRFKQQYPDQVRLFLSAKRPVQHYGVADGRHMYFEDTGHALGKQPGVLFRYDDPKFGHEWISRFARYISLKAPEIQF